MTERTDSEKVISVLQVGAAGRSDADDRVAVEEPMEIRVLYGPDGSRSARSLSVTMRTPGHDFELAAGFLFTERIVTRADQIRAIEFTGPTAPGRATSNTVTVELDAAVAFDVEGLQRHFFASSSCGICGKASLDTLHVRGLEPLNGERPRLRRSWIHRLPDELRARQTVFESTGGIHASGLVDSAGTLVRLREDVGRHNAVDKLVGRAFLDGATPLSDHAMVVSGRTSFEILQKALAAGLPAIIAVGAPSSLAVETAERFGMTLIGFASRERFNIYAGRERIVED